MDEMDFTFSDTIAGYVIDFDRDSRSFGLKTSDGREFRVQLTSTTYAEVLRNLGEQYQVPAMSIEDMLVPGRYLFAHGIFYPEGGTLQFDGKHIVLVGQGPNEYRFEEADWWINQIRSLAEFYIKAQFPDGVVDYRNYRTHLTVEGQKVDSTRQETDTISRMIYGFASAYLLTGDDRYLECAEKGTEYLRDHLRAVQEQEGVVYWYHAIDVRGGRERKVLASQFGDDIDAIPIYEQIYALAGPVQTYRVTGDPRILRDAAWTLSLFERFFRDPDRGGYFSHLDPVTLDPRSESLRANRAKKNWNSVGDHAPAYLINLWLATGDERFEDFLVNTADTIVEHFPDYEHSPFVQERFHEDWSHDTTWGWQQNRGVVGHNLKIAWNLMRIHHLRPNERYTELARKIAAIMPTVGMDRQRGGWYDGMERVRSAGEEWHRFVWHDRKAWWQQEQAILAFLILYSSLRQPEYRQLARESMAFYNAFFLDHDNGGVYFNVQATGFPFLLGTERLKGSHSMSGYHSFELCYLAAVYSNLLINKRPMNLYFKPKPGSFKDNLLRVMPDILPPGSVRIEQVWLNGDRYQDFDPVAGTVTLPSMQQQSLAQRPPWAGNPSLMPTTTSELKVCVRLAPTGTLFDAQLDLSDEVGQLVLYGDLSEVAAPAFKAHMEKIVAAQPRRVVLRMEDLQTIAEIPARMLCFFSDKFTANEAIYVVGTNEKVKATLQQVGIWEELNAMETYDEVRLRS